MPPASGLLTVATIALTVLLAVAGWIIFAILALSVILNAITPSVLERAIWLPVTLLLAAATLVIALAPQ